MPISLSSFHKFTPVNEYITIWDYRGIWNGLLVGKEDEDNKVRASHFFSSGCPHPELAISILTLSKSTKVSIVVFIDQILSRCGKTSLTLAILFANKLAITIRKTIFLESLLWRIFYNQPRNWFSKGHLTTRNFLFVNHIFETLIS